MAQHCLQTVAFTSMPMSIDELVRSTERVHTTTCKIENYCILDYVLYYYQVSFLWRFKSLAQTSPLQQCLSNPFFHSSQPPWRKGTISKMPLRERAREAHRACISEYAAHVQVVWMTEQTACEFMRLTLSGKRIKRRTWSDAWRSG
jgi:hypothetical protein